MQRGIRSETSEAAEQGTAAHELREFCIKFGVSPHDCIGDVHNNHVVDVNMADAVSVDVNLMRSLSLKYGVKPLLEQRVAMTSLGRNDVYGTADTTFIVHDKRIVHTLDYKHGFGIVDVNENKQMLGYGISTLDTFDLWGDVDEVHTTVVQPRADHINGPIRTQVYTIDEIWDWQARFARSVDLADDPTVKPVAGSHCRYCRAAGKCRARLELTLQEAYTDCPPNELSKGEIEVMYSAASGIINHMEAIQKEATMMAKQGYKFRDYKMVESRPRSKVMNEGQLIADAKAHNVNIDRMYDKVLKSESSIKKVLPPELVSKHYVKPDPVPMLVSMKDKRPALRIGSAEGKFKPIKPSAEGRFKPIK
jgi:hypothetical protein